MRAFVLRTETCSKCPSTYRATSTRIHAQAVQHHYPNGICTVASTCSQRGINVRTSNSNAFRCNLRIQVQPRAVVRKNATLELLVKFISRNRTKKNGDCMANCVQKKREHVHIKHKPNGLELPGSLPNKNNKVTRIQNFDSQCLV